MKLNKAGFRRALVTGGAGFIGSNLIDELLTHDIDVVSIDDYSTGKKRNLAHLRGHPRFTEIKCDITDLKELEKHFDGVDIVFHQAASKKTICLKDPRRDLDVNGKGTFNILELARDRGVKKIVHASTGSVYGEAVYFPQDEEHPLTPRSYYGVSKLAGERYVKAFSLLYGLNVTILRYFHVYGPRQDYSNEGGVVSIFCHRVMNGLPPVICGDGSQQRSFTFVKDVVNANIFAALSNDSNGECYNCASGLRITIGELAQKVIDIFGRKDLELQYADWAIGDIKVFDVGNRKIMNQGFRFQTGFDEGLKRTVDWFVKEGNNPE